MKRLALVIDTNDSDKQGKIKLRILPEMNMMSEDHLPWAKPQIHSSYGLSKEEVTYSHNIPELNTLIYCDVSDDWTSFYYLDEIPYYGPGYSYEDTISSIQESIEDLEEQTYPQPSYQRTKDGTIAFHNTETGESGVVYSSGTYFYIRSDGTLKIKSGETSVEILENGSIQLTGSNVSFLFDNENKKLILTDVENLEVAGASDFAVLFSPLKEILEKLLDHNHIAPTGPTTPAQEASGTPLSALKSKINDMKSIIKTD
jgi:hypothetical protein